MRLNLKKIVGGAFLAKNLTKFSNYALCILKKELKKAVRMLAIQGMLVLLLIQLLGLSLLFGLIALAIYLNEVLGSSYQGFLMIAGVCITLALLLLLLLKQLR